MNPRLLAYLRSLGLDQNASDGDAWDFYSQLRGVQRSIANALNYNEADQQARTNCDLMLRSLGYNPENPVELLEPETQRTATQEPPVDVQRQAGSDGASNQGDLEAARTQAAQDERRRQQSIRELAEISRVSEEMLRTALDQGHAVSRAQEDFLRDYRERTRADVPADALSGGAPAGHARNSRSDFDRNSLIAAMMLREGVNDPTRSWPVMNAANGSIRTNDMGSDANVLRAVERGHEVSGLSLIEICRRALEIDGVRCEPTASGIAHAVREAHMRRGAIASFTLTGVMTTSFTAVLVSAYEEAPDSTMGWVNERSVPNYQLNERTRMEAMEGLSKRSKGKEADSATVTDAQETYRVAEYAKQFVIDQQDLINDSFGALESFSPIALGRAAARLRPDLVYAILLANAAMRDGTALFHANHSNLKTSAALGVTTLEAARAAMRIQTENSVNLNLMPRYLIVPGQLESTAETLVESNLVVTGSDTVRGHNNSNARAGLRVVADARLDNGVTDPNSGTAYSGSASTWFLSAAGDGHTIEVGYVRELGRNPTVRSKVLDEGRFGIAFDVQHSIGAKAIDWRGLVKNTA